jgi:hypothetical protein
MLDMARASLVLSILVASPGDVPAERDVVGEAINQWNSEHSRQMKLHLEAVRWETHAYPATGGRPQGFVNEQMADACDFAIAVFGSRVGTPTGKAQSGTIEEIERLRSKGKQVALYFSNALLPRDFDEAQYAALKQYRKEREQDSLVWEFSDAKQLKDLVSHHLPSLVEEAHKRLRASGELEQVEKELENSQQVVSQELKQMVESSDAGSEPIEAALNRLRTLELEIEVHKQYPDAALLLRSNKHVKLTRIDYLDDHGAKRWTFNQHRSGREFEIPIDLRAITEIFNTIMKPFHVMFALHLLDGSKPVIHKLPVMVNQRFKPLDTGGLVAYMHLSG